MNIKTKTVSAVLAVVTLVLMVGMFGGVLGGLSTTMGKLEMAVEETTSDTAVASRKANAALVKAMNGAVVSENEASGGHAIDGKAVDGTVVAYNDNMEQVAPLGESVTSGAKESRNLLVAITVQVLGAAALGFVIVFVISRLAKESIK